MGFRHAVLLRAFSFVGFALALGFTSPTFAEPSPYWTGFKSADDSAVPEAVKKASASVFKILYPFGSPLVMDLSATTLESQPTSGGDQLKELQIQVCRNQKIRKCPVMPKLYSGTAFLGRDSRTIVTNLHNVQSWLYYAKKLNPELDIKNIQSPIMLATEKGVLFNPVNPKMNLKLSFFNGARALFTQEVPWEGGDDHTTVLFRISDYVELHASAPSSRVPLAYGKVQRNEPLYVVGYPHATDYISKYGAQDSTGETLLVSVGQVLANSSLENINFNTSAAAAPGSSGSPLLTAKGEVVGVLFSGGSVEQNGAVVSVSQFLQTDLDLLKSVWSQFK